MLVQILVSIHKASSSSHQNALLITNKQTFHSTDLIDAMIQALNAEVYACQITVDSNVLIDLIVDLWIVSYFLKIFDTWINVCILFLDIDSFLLTKNDFLLQKLDRFCEVENEVK